MLLKNEISIQKQLVTRFAFLFAFVFNFLFSFSSISQCVNTPFLGNDTSVCINQNLQLSGPANFLNYVWNTGATTPNINITNPGTYWCKASTMGPTNLVVNGNFSSGNAGFSTGHTLGTGGSWGLLSSAGTYAISTNANLTHNNFPSCSDHTSGTGNYMVVNGSSTANLSVWCQTVTVTPNTTYFFSAWITSVVSGSPAILRFTANGAAMGANHNVSNTTCSWQNFFQTWSSGPTTTSVNLCITNQNTAGGGNDFGLDDISFNTQCEIIDTIIVTNTISPQINIGSDTTICDGDTIQVDATDTIGSTYLWSTGDTIPILAITGTNFLTVTVTRGNCSVTATKNVFTIASPIVQFGNDTTLCVGSSISLFMQAANASYIWSNNQVSSLLMANQDTTYWGTTTNICGSASDTITIEIDSFLIVDLGPQDTVLCTGDTYNLSSNIIGNSYLWNNGNTLNTTQINTVYTYKLSVTNVCGTFTDTINVDYDTSPITYIGPDSIYCITNLQTLSTAWSRSTFLWNNGDVSPSILANTSGTYWVQVTNLCGFDDDTVNIAYQEPIFVSLGPDTNVCKGDTISLNVPSTATWTWNDGTTDTIQNVFEPGLYSVATRNNCGTFSDSIFISEIDIPKITSPGNDTIFCEGLSFSQAFNPSTSDSIIWMDGFRLYTRIFDSNAVYSYELSNICGAVYDTFIVIVDTPAEADLGNDTTICFGEVVTKSFDLPKHTYLWSTGSTDSFNVFMNRGLYSLTITSPGLCETYTEFIINPCESQPFIPNAFSPGSTDNINTHFTIKGEGIRKFRIAIYDRWGSLVFESFDMTNSWNGTVGSKEAATGVYSYVIWYNTGIKSESVTLTGEVYLIR
ncbi:MAG: gliding motility-associated-like protein [Halieaceae bacterium]